MSRSAKWGVRLDLVRHGVPAMAVVTVKEPFNHEWEQTALLLDAQAARALDRHVAGRRGGATR